MDPKHTHTPDLSAMQSEVYKKVRSTSIDVAKLAGVSQASVSRAFDPASKMRSETREKILLASKQLKYTPDAIAKSMISNSTNIIAIIMQDVVNPFYSKILKEFSLHLRKYGKQLLYFYLDSPDNLHNMIYQALQYRVDGIIITSITLTSEIIDTFVDYKVPVVLFNRYVDIPQIQAVCCDNMQAGRECADYFFSKGYRNFAFVGGSDEALTSHDRRNGFLSRLNERGIHDVITINTDFTYASGYQAFHELAKDGSKFPLAVFCASDVICAGVMDCIRHNHGLRIPEDVALIGFDDIQLASYDSYQITSFTQPIEKMIEKTCELILNPGSVPQIPNLTLFPCELNMRTSS